MPKTQPSATPKVKSGDSSCTKFTPMMRRVPDRPLRSSRASIRPLPAVRATVDRVALDARVPKWSLSSSSCYPRFLRLGTETMKIRSLAFLLMLLLTISAAAQNTPHFDGQAWWNHIKFLADDKLEGRDTGSRGEREAQAYAVDQLKRAGAEPAGLDGFYQPVKFVSRQIIEEDCSLTLIHNGKREPLTLGEDAIISTRVMPAPEVEAPLVFVGYGLKVPEKNYDDFAGIDVRGKIIVIFSGSPSEIPGALASHYQTAAERWKVLRAAGAVGIVSLINPNSMDIPWSRMALNRAHPSMDLDYPEFNETEGAKIAVTVNPPSAEKFFAGSGHTFEEIVALGKDRKPLPHFPLAVSLAAKTRVDVTR